jgi:hypothetical protein
MADNSKIFLLGGLGVAAYFAYTQGWLASLFGPTVSSSVLSPSALAAVIAQGQAAGMTNAQIQTALNNLATQASQCGANWNPNTGTCSGAPAGSGVTQQQIAPSASQPVLTAADAATFPYSGSVTSAQMNAISGTLDPQIQAGQIPQIAGGSVLAYMLGWGNASAGQSQTVYGETYTFDGTNWNLQPASAPTSSSSGGSSSSGPTAAGLALQKQAAAQLQSGISALQAQISNLQPLVTANPTNVQYQTMLSQLQTQLQSLQSNLTAVQGLAGLGDYEDDGFVDYAAPWAPSRVPLELIHGGPYLRFWRDA